LFRSVHPVRGFGFNFEAPVLASVNGWALMLALAAAAAIVWWRAGMVPVLAGCAAAGVSLYAAGMIG
jgi:chromate transporter